MVHKSILLAMSMSISMHAFFNEQNAFINHFDSFDDIIDHMNAFTQELKEFEKSITEQTTKNSGPKPHIALIDGTKDISVVISNIELAQSKDVEAIVLYDAQKEPNTIKIKAATYTIDISYDRQNRYVGTYVVYQAPTKRKEKKSKTMQSVHLSVRKGQTILNHLKLEDVVVEADVTQKKITVTIPKTEEQTKHKKINVKTINVK